MVVRRTSPRCSADSLFTRALRNSIGISLIATLLSVVVAMFAAYAIARLDFPGKKVLLSLALAIAMFPQAALVGPLFNMWRNIGIYDTWIGLIIPYLTFALPLSIWTLSAFFRQIPWEMEQAAQVDGATTWQAFRKVIVPLAAPGVFTTAILTFFFCWNDFLFAISLTSTDRARTVPAALAFFTGASQFQSPITDDHGGVGRRHHPRRHPGAGLPAPDRRRPHLRRRQGLIEGIDRHGRDHHASNIIKEYGDGFPAVNDVSLDIADGEFMILVGPSGCGKSTLLRMIVGLEDITSGDMIIGGKRVNDKAPRDRNLAMVFQNYALYPHLTVFENIAFPLRLQGKHSDEEIRKLVNEAAETLELHRAPGAQAGQPLRRPAPAGRDGPGHRPPGRRVPVRRAAVQPRRQAARPDAHRDPAPAAPPRHHHRLRHPRPDRGHDPRRPGGGAAQGRAAAGRQPTRALRAAGQPVRRRLHRLAADELHPRRVTRRAPRAAVRIHPGAPGVDQVVGDRPLLIAGIRPGSFEDASLVDPDKAGRGMTFDVTVDVTEWLGNEQYAYVPYEAPTDIAAQLAELASRSSTASRCAPSCVCRSIR